MNTQTRSARIFPANTGSGFWGSSPLIPIFRVGKTKKKSHGMGASSEGPSQPRGMLRRPRRPQRLRGAVANCPRKSPRSTALRRLFF